ELIERQPTTAFTSLAAQGDHPLPVVLPSGPAPIPVAFVSGQFFETLGTHPVAGRLLNTSDAPAGAVPVVVISETLWRGAFNGDPAVLGQSLTIGARPFTIVGVTPAGAPGLRVLDVGSSESEYPQAWLPLHNAVYWDATKSSSTPWLSLAGRLSDRSSLRA